MKKTRAVRSRRAAPRQGLFLPLLFAVLLTGAITLFALWIQPNSLRAVLSVFRAQPLLIVLNCLPVGLLVLGFSFLFGDVFYGAAFVNFFAAALSLVNRIKLVIRDEPLVPKDFGLAKEAFDAAGSYHLSFPWGIVALILLFTLILILLGRFWGCRLSVSRTRQWLGRVLGFAGCLAVLTGMILTVYASSALYNSFRVSNSYYIPSVFNELGFPYCFCYNFSTYQLEKPEGFSKTEAAAYETGDQTGLGKSVNVIMVMNEAFSDLTDDPAFTYGSGEDDPLQNLHRLQADANCISGHLVVPNFAGGTANTEFDVLSGMQTNALSQTSNSAFRSFNRNIDSLFRVFDADGYHTSFLHPGDAWFYNRENAYRYMGAQEILFDTDMTNLTYKGRWVTDDCMADLIEQKFEDSVSAGQPLFSYTTTIQNHMSYTADKYGPDYVFPPVETNVALSDQAKTLLSVYIEGVRDADAMLGKLYDYFAASDQPVVLVFWGDHRPYLGDDQLCYKELSMGLTPNEGGTSSYLSSYETPFVIWANNKAAQELNWNDDASSLGLGKQPVISACYLGATVLEAAGRGDESAWFQYLDQLRRELPVIQNQTYLLSDGSVTTQLGSGQAQEIAKLRKWTYYKLKYKDVG